LRHLTLNEAPVLRDDAEGIHQMRVALRRLRASISLFKEMLQDPQSEQVKGQLKWLTVQLGPARDMDVFVKEAVAPLQQVPSQKEKLEKLEPILKEKRAAGFEKAKEAIRSDRYRHVVLEAALWLICGQWLQNADPLLQARRERPVREFASEVLTSRTKKILSKIRKLRQLDAQRRHKLRIAIKKLRYATEFFESLYPGRRSAMRRKGFRKILKQLQTALGKLNDITVHEHLGEDVVASVARRDDGKGAQEVAFAMGLVTGQEHAQVEPFLSAAIKAGKKLAQQPDFGK
jgi:CHAD domain-containing protein